VTSPPKRSPFSTPPQDNCCGVAAADPGRHLDLTEYSIHRGTVRNNSPTAPGTHLKVVISGDYRVLERAESVLGSGLIMAFASRFVVTSLLVPPPPRVAPIDVDAPSAMISSTLRKQSGQRVDCEGHECLRHICRVIPSQFDTRPDAEIALVGINKKCVSRRVTPLARRSS
jgi:hypothetical protein